MGFFTNNPEEDDIFLYADDVAAEGTDTNTTLEVLERSVILIDTDSEKPANMTYESQIISSLVLAWQLAQLLFSLQMGFFTSLRTNPEDDDMPLYADDVTAEENSVILIDTDFDEKPANLSCETQIISSPSILSGDSSRAGERINKRMYRCRKCGKSKKGHVCLMDSYTSSEDSVVMDEPSEGSRKASNRQNLTRLAQRVDDDNSSDPDWVASRRIDGSSIRTSPRLLARKRTVSTIVTETEEKELQTIPKKARKV
ncbi:hypothetical protein OUZ56_016059 [Daphnia magna]|uniref:Uncharacterized protein n=1 Tax=Daphnia magna TaxID=35525 RepID=A0ABR0API3_9CRUS|nr:hypothetical protein OUZ56_016059 [Daphnia magna]